MQPRRGVRVDYGRRETLPETSSGQSALILDSKKRAWTGDHLRWHFENERRPRSIHPARIAIDHVVGGPQIALHQSTRDWRALVALPECRAQSLLEFGIARLRHEPHCSQRIEKRRVQ